MWKSQALRFQSAAFLQLVLNIQRAHNNIHKPEFICILQFICGFVFL